MKNFIIFSFSQVLMDQGCLDILEYANLDWSKPFVEEYLLPVEFCRFFKIIIDFACSFMLSKLWEYSLKARLYWSKRVEIFPTIASGSSVSSKCSNELMVLLILILWSCDGIISFEGTVNLKDSTWVWYLSYIKLSSSSGTGEDISYLFKHNEWLALFIIIYILLYSSSSIKLDFLLLCKCEGESPGSPGSLRTKFSSLFYL